MNIPLLEGPRLRDWVYAAAYPSDLEWDKQDRALQYNANITYNSKVAARKKNDKVVHTCSLGFNLVNCFSKMLNSGS